MRLGGTMKFATLKFLTVIWLWALVAANAYAADKCDEAGEKGYSNVNSVYDPKIELFLKISGALKEKGFDPKRYPVVFPDGRVEPLDLTDTVQKLALQKASAYNKIKDAVDECNKGFAVPQKIADTAVFFATGGLSAILPSSFSHVDASQILSGTVFGGPDALIPKMRDDLLNGLGISGDVACIIRDPKKIFGGC